MSEIIFPTFPSAFENSVLGPYWEIENRSYGQNTNILPDGGDTMNEHDILTIRYKPYDTKERYYSQAAHPLGVRSFIILKAGSGVTPLGGKTLKLKTYSGFDSTAIEEVYGVKIGEFLIKLENTEEEDKSHVEKLVRLHLDWLFSEDIEGKEKYYKVFYDKAILYYNLQKEGSPNFVWAALMKLVGVTIAQFWAEALKYLANEIRERFKITNSNHWNPYNDDGTQNENYMPVFFPLGQTIDKALTEMDIKFKRVRVFAINEPQIIKIDNPTLDQGNELLKTTFDNGIKSLKNDLLQSIKAVVDLPKQLLNAFFVGLYNGGIEIVAGSLEIIGQLLKLGDPKVRAKILEAIKWVFTYIKQEGILNTLVEIVKILTLEYREAKNIYEILKTLGEDLVEIIVAIILAFFTGGVTIFQKIKNFVEALKELAQKTKGAYEEFREAVDKLKRKFKETNDSSIEVEPKVFSHLDEVSDTADTLNIVERKSIIADVQNRKIKLDEFPDGSPRKSKDYTRYSNYGEMVVDDYFLTKLKIPEKPNGTFKRIHLRTVNTLDDKIEKGIDCVYEFSSPPPKYVICEAKYGSSKLSMTKSGKQMSRRWIRQRLLNAVGEDKLDDILIHGYESVLAKVAREGNVRTSKLNELANEIGQWP